MSLFRPVPLFLFLSALDQQQVPQELPFKATNLGFKNGAANVYQAGGRVPAPGNVSRAVDCLC